MTTVGDIVKFIEKEYPLHVQEDYDNSGLITGDEKMPVTGILLTIDVNEAVIDEASQKNLNLIIAHHPLIFRAIKKINGKNRVERTLIKAIKNDIAIYAAHTSVDNSINGLNKYICDNLGLKNCKILLPKKELLFKLVTFVPFSHSQKVKEALFSAGAGHIGNYDSCSYNVEGYGTFRAGENTNPFVGKIGELHTEKEERIETVFTAMNYSKVIQALLDAHPYEEPAYDIYKLENTAEKYGSGIIGEFDEPQNEKEFLLRLKEFLKIPVLKHSALLNKKIKKVAICTGGCGFLTEKAISAKADVFISGELRYDNYVDAQNKILLVEAGHYETEILIKNVFYDFITKNFTNFATEFSEKFKNPVNYL